MVADWCRENARSAPVDLVLTGGEEIGLGDGWFVRVLHVPGHSTGHLAIVDPRSGALVISDGVLGDSVNLADGSPAFPPTYRWAKDYLDTVDACAALAPSYLLTAHYPTMDAEQGARFLSTSREWARHTDQVVLDFVAAAGSPPSVRDVVLGVADRLGPWPMSAAASALGQPVVGHLEWLTDRGELAVEHDGGIRRWRVAR